MAKSKDDIKKYGNIDEIKDSKITSRAERLSNKDKDILSQPSNTLVNFGEFNENKVGEDQFVELHIYDENDIKLESIYTQKKLSHFVQKAVGDSTTGNQIVFKPNDDLRAAGFDFGGFKLVYNVFEELLGKRDGHHVYIEEISPSRKEIRVLPVTKYPRATEDKTTKPFIGSPQYPSIDEKEKSLNLNHIFSSQQWDNRLELQKYNLLDRRFIHDFCEFSTGNDSDTWVFNKGKIFTSADSNEEITLEGGKFTKAMEGGLIRVYDVNDKNRIIYQTRINKIKSGGRRATVSESYRIGTVKTKLPRMNYELQYIRSQQVKKDDLKNLAVFGDNRNLLVTNWELDNITFDDYPYSAIIRLYKPLPSDIQLKDTFHLVREIIPPVIENVFLESDTNVLDGTYLRPPDFNVDDKYLNDTSRATELETWEELLGGDPQTSNKIIDEMASAESASINISVDYTQFANFINFSSATERLKNFKYKLDLIEGYDVKINELSVLSGSYLEVEKTTKIQRNIKADFDPFEKWMYHESHSKAVPKSSDTLKPYINYAATSSEFTSWYEESLISASIFDRANTTMLKNSLPAHIREDKYNEEFNLFFDMCGQHFDTLWIYIKSMTDQNFHYNKLDEGISKDVVPEMIKNIGLNLQNGTDARRLWRHYLGADSSGSYDGSGTDGAAVGDVVSSADYTKEIWKRILANMPYLLKTKGTSRSIKALVSCYGIPSTILDIREYGGPTPKIDEEIYMYSDEFSYALDLRNEGYISSSWSPLQPTDRQADTIQIRHEGVIGKEGTANQRQMILEASSSYTQWGITAKNNGSTTDSKGYYTFFISSSGADFGSDPGILEISSSELNIFDGNYRSIMLSRTKTGSLDILDNDNPNQAVTYTLKVGEYNNEFQKVTNIDNSYLHLSGSALTDHDNRNEAFSQSADLFIGGTPTSNLGIQMSGSVQEFRLWHGEVLTEATFKNHIAAPRSYQGNKYDSAKKYNTIRYSFNQRKKHDLETYYTESNGSVLSNKQIIDQSINTTQDTHAWAVGFQSKSGQSNPYHYKSEVSQHKYAVPALGSNVPAEKIRNIDNTLDFGQLHVKKSVEKSSTAYAPNDSPRVGIYFSPTNLIDIDIIREYGGGHLASAMGDPIDAYYGRYRDLNKLRREYFLKYNGVNAVYEYIKLIDYYDRSLFDTIKKFLPARSAANVGLSIEPSLLERNRHPLKPLIVEENNFEGKVDIEQYIARDDKDDGFGMTYGGDEGYEEGGLDATPKLGGEEHSDEGTVSVTPDLIGEEHSDEGTVNVTPTLTGSMSNHEGTVDKDAQFNLTGEKSNLEGGIDPDSYFNWDGELRNYEGLIGEDGETRPIRPGGESRNYEGVIGEEPGDKPIIPGGESRNYEGLIGTEESLVIELGGRSPNYEGSVLAETQINLDGTSRNYEGLIGTDELPQIGLTGESTIYESTIGERKNKFSGTVVEEHKATAKISFTQPPPLSSSVTLESYNGTTKTYEVTDTSWPTPFVYYSFDTGSAEDFSPDGVFTGATSSAEILTNSSFKAYVGDETASLDFGDWTENQTTGDAWYSTGSDERTIRMETRIVPVSTWHHRIRQAVDLVSGSIYEYRFKTRGSYPKWTIRISNGATTHVQDKGHSDYFGDRHGNLSGPTESFADHRFLFQCTYASDQFVDIFPLTGGTGAPLQVGDFLEIKDISLKELSPISGSGKIPTTQGSMGDPSIYNISNASGNPKVGYESVTGKGSVLFTSHSWDTGGNGDELQVESQLLDLVINSGSNFSMMTWVKRALAFRSGSTSSGGAHYDPGYSLEDQGNDGYRDRFGIMMKGTYGNSFGITYEYDKERFVAGGRDSVNTESICHATVTDGLSGSFSHVAVTYESGSQEGIKLYVNGELKDTAPWQATSLQNAMPTGISGSEHDFLTTDNLKIGGNDVVGGSTTFFSGYIDDPRIYAKVVSPEEIRYIYKNPGSLDGISSGSYVYFESGSTAAITVENLAAVISKSDGHGTNLNVTYHQSGTMGDVDLTQPIAGLIGNKPILYSNSITSSLDPPIVYNFINGQKTVARNITYSTVFDNEIGVNAVILGGEQNSFEGTMLSGMRENRDFPINEKGTGTGRWTPWLLEEWQKNSGSYRRTAFREGTDVLGNGFLTQSTSDQEFNQANLVRIKGTFKTGETFPMYSKKSVRPDYFYTSSKGSHSNFVTEHSYRQVQYESGSGTLIEQKVRGGKVITQGRLIKYYEPAQFTPFTSTADLNNRFEGCKMTSTGKDGKSLYQITPQDWLELDKSRDTVDGLPVVEVNDTTPTQLFVTTPPSGQSDLEGY